ncbi:ThiF family protein [uncultured Desulfatiglans sp.]|uniref:ThiF family protein n=1 Tax=Uncultured Desulfatiglans sp. TaxID=1748965 RepID=A0A653AE84_UNCDX|nr:ThiF family protein [uncultured Desulfatiglans sp.]
MSILLSEEQSALLENAAESVLQPSGEALRILREKTAAELVEKWGMTLRAVHEAAMHLGIYPARYSRNRGSISLEEQIGLSHAQVSVIGAGGLGGTVIELLARLGVGRIVVADHDRFDETNLNRQALSRTGNLGAFKAEEAVRAVQSINPAVEVIARTTRLTSTNAEEFLTGSLTAVDALDNIPDRFLLESAARRLGIPLVHAALAGFEGQLMTIFPEDRGLELLYGTPSAGRARSAAPEAVLGVPTPTPTLLATLQTMEVLKILTGRGQPIRNAMLHVDLGTGSFDTFSFDPSPRQERGGRRSGQAAEQ